MSDFLGGFATGISGAASLLSDVASLTGGSGWARRRRPASYRGVPFVILENEMKRGRQLALHLYPFKDTPWPEDLGRSPRITSFRGFVVGDDCDQKMRALMAAVELPGPGQLVHPTLGPFSVQVLSFSCSDAADRGRVWSFEMSVTPYEVRIYPTAAADTQAQSRGLFGSFGAAVARDFAAVQQTVDGARQAVAGVVQTAQGYAAQAQGLIHDATSLAHLPAALIGNFGRFAGGAVASNVPGLAVLNASGAVTALAQASGTVNGAFGAVSRISGTLSVLAGRL